MDRWLSRPPDPSGTACRGSQGSRQVVASVALCEGRESRHQHLPLRPPRRLAGGDLPRGSALSRLPGLARGLALLSLSLAGLAAAAHFGAARRAGLHLRTSAGANLASVKTLMVQTIAGASGASDAGGAGPGVKEAGAGAEAADGRNASLGVEGVDWVGPEEPEPRLDEYFQAIVKLKRSAAIEWEVIYDADPVNVRLRPNLTERVVGRKIKGDIVVGHRVGEWVKLLDGSGFVLISLDLEHVVATLLKQRPATYLELISGRCQDVGMYNIFVPESCQAAGFTLDHFDKHVEVYRGAELVRPEGCYVLKEKKGELWVATNPANRGHGASRLRRQICSSRAPLSTPGTQT